MVKQTQLYPNEPAQWLGDLHPLAEQLGSADGLMSLASALAPLQLGPVHNISSLRKFLHRYQQRILFPFELPAIKAAYEHALKGETRELIALDQRLGTKGLLKEFSSASCRVGLCQLQKFRPLRDQRLVQRFLSAVEEGRAQGWHTLVYGITLVIYSLPLRQGLLGYAQQTTRSFIHHAAGPLRLSERTCRNLFDELSGQFAQAVESLLHNNGGE
jgi:urease accessory protein UreF